MIKRLISIIIPILTLGIIVFYGFQQPDETRKTVSLYTGGYDFRVADKVVIDTDQIPQHGDLILYDSDLNHSSFGAMGPTQHIVRVIGCPGDMVKFGATTMEVNGYTITAGQVDDTYISCLQWGSEKFSKIAYTSLPVPDGEYLVEYWLGANLPNDVYNRYTVWEEAILGVIIRKAGHDGKLERELRDIIY